MADSVSVAGYIAQQLGDDGAHDQMRLQKLLYYSQGWSLAWTGRRLFNDEFQAWVGGPVVPSVYKIAGKRRLPMNVALPAAQRAIVDAVVGFYGAMTGPELSALTHAESPWVEARGDLPAERRSTRPVTVDSIRRYFGTRTLTGEPRPKRPAVIDDQLLRDDVLEAGKRATIRWKAALDELANR
jgi:uncharacterized phage-associated protein